MYKSLQDTCMPCPQPTCLNWFPATAILVHVVCTRGRHPYSYMYNKLIKAHIYSSKIFVCRCVRVAPRQLNSTCSYSGTKLNGTEPVLGICMEQTLNAH